MYMNLFTDSGLILITFMTPTFEPPPGWFGHSLHNVGDTKVYLYEVVDTMSTLHKPKV